MIMLSGLVACLTDCISLNRFTCSAALACAPFRSGHGSTRRCTGRANFRLPRNDNKYVANRLLTALQNIMVGSKLSEFHTGYRAYSRRVLERLPLPANSDGFVFDNQMLTQAVAFGFPIGEISCPTRYFPEASSINLRNSIRYGIGVIITSVKYRLWRWNLARPVIFSDTPALRIDSALNTHP